MMADLLVILSFILMTISSTAFSKIVESSSSENITSLCDSSLSRNKIQCYCRSTMVASKSFVFRAECTINEDNISINDDIWQEFSLINTIETLILTSKYNALTYIPTPAIKKLRGLLKLSIKHGKIDNLYSYAFANLTSIEDIKLSSNNIKELYVNAFAYLPNVTSITLDNNKIEEIKRNVFRRLPQLQGLYLTSNNISMIHDRAFSHLNNLKTLELDKNSIFVLTNETFWGLENLTRLELSENDLEVVGENTFEVLRNLRSLNLNNNKIGLLDDKAFNGLLKLESLSLANNQLKELSNPKLFLGLPMLMVLDVKSNSMKTFRNETLGPILHNFYSIGSSLGFEENSFTCDCNINWFLVLKNRTKNKRLQQSIDNLMCYPSPTLAEEFKKYEETENITTERITDNEKTNAPNEYDYYDETNMGGKLFFTDIPNKILPCDETPRHTMISSSISQYSTAYHTTDLPKTTLVTKTAQITEQTTYPPSSIVTSVVLEERKHKTYPSRTTIQFPRRTELVYASETPEYTAVPQGKENETNAQIEYKPESMTRNFPSVNNFSPTEEMVSDDETTLTDLKMSTNSLYSQNQEEISSTSIPAGRDNLKEPFISSSNQHKAPESMSRVDATDATSSASKGVEFFISTMLLLMFL